MTDLRCWWYQLLALLRIVLVFFVYTSEQLEDDSAVRTSIIEACSTTDGLTDDICDERLVFEYAVEGGQNRTDVIQVMIDSVVTDASQDSDLLVTSIENQEVSIQIRRTPIYFQYPTTYHQTYNYQVLKNCLLTSLCFHHNSKTLVNFSSFYQTNKNIYDHLGLRTCIVWHFRQRWDLYLLQRQSNG